MCFLPQKVKNEYQIQLIKYYETMNLQPTDGDILNLVSIHLSGVISSVLIGTKHFIL